MTENIEENEFEINLTNNSTVEEIVTIIESQLSRENPRISSIHSVFLKKGSRQYKIATCWAIKNEHTGEIHHYSIEISHIIKKENKWYYDKNYKIIEDLDILNTFYQFLSVIKDKLLIEEKGKFRIVNEKDYLNFEKMSKNEKTQIIKSLLSENNGIEEIVKLGNTQLLKKIIEFSIKTDNTKQIVENLEQVIGSLKNLDKSNRNKILEFIKNQNLTKEDLNIISGRKDSLDTFRKNLNSTSEWKEKDWQKFFENNTWVFGSSLDYKFLRILQREAHISNSDLDGSNEVIVDFLMGCNNFTVLVEIKRPDAKLFNQSESGRNRADSWKLSSDLVDAVTQILSQKANWTIKGNIGENFNDSEEPITQGTHDPKTILVIGNSNEFAANDRITKMKAKTFELFRRNCRNIEIITFDELFEKANFIVNN
jgi:hypothetical protein